MYYWHWLGGHDRWYDWSPSLAITSRTINHDWSYMYMYLSYSSIVRNRSPRLVVRASVRLLQMEIVWLGELLIVRVLDTQSRTTGGATTHEWWCDHTRLVVRPCKTYLRLVIADNSQTVLNIRLILLVRSPTTTTISGTFSLRFDSDS